MKIGIRYQDKSIKTQENVYSAGVIYCVNLKYIKSNTENTDFGQAYRIGWYEAWRTSII